MLTFEELTQHCELHETEEFTIFWFINGLKVDIKCEVFLQQYSSMEEAYHKALEIEAYLHSFNVRQASTEHRPQCSQSTAKNFNGSLAVSLRTDSGSITPSNSKSQSNNKG